MKLYYFAYILRQVSTQEKYLHNIADFASAFHHSENNSLKTSFKRGDDKLYLTKIDGYQNTFYFLKTSNDDLLKRINEQDFSVTGMGDKLESNEKMAFTSHIHFSTDQSVLAIASGIGCPRFDIFAEYINELFIKVGLADFEIELIALSSSASKKDLLEMEVVNSIYVDVDADEGIGKALLKELAGDNTPGVGSFRIIIEPTAGNMTQALKSIISRKESNNTSGIIKLGAKAKHDEFKGQLMEYWLDNESSLADKINPRTKRKNIADQIGEKFDSNLQLSNLYKNFVDNQNNLIVAGKADLLAYNNKSKFNESTQLIEKNDENSDS